MHARQRRAAWFEGVPGPAGGEEGGEGEERERPRSDFRSQTRNTTVELASNAAGGKKHDNMLPAIKQSILQSLNKLSDNHTRQKAWEELVHHAERVDHASLPAFLQCLHSTTAQHTIACRRGAIRMYGHLAHLHPDLVMPHVPKISDAITARLKEKDATRELRDACAAAFAQLVQELGSDAVMLAVLRPLLPLISEPSEPYQLGCAICLAAILPAAGAQGDLPEAAAQRIATPLLRTLAHPAVGAHPALMDAAGTLLLQAGCHSGRSFASSFLSSALNAASSPEWAARRSSADLVRAVAASHPDVAAAFASRAHASLHLLRADKQKSVREAASAALSALREVHNTPRPELPAAATAAAARSCARCRRGA